MQRNPEGKGLRIATLDQTYYKLAARRTVEKDPEAVRITKKSVLIS